MTKEELEKEALLFLIKKHNLRSDLQVWEIIRNEELSKEYDSYLAGAELGYNKSVIWHDLCKDPSDLPVGVVLNQNGKVVWYDGGIGVWRYDDDDTICSSIIAWCEIPIFEGGK